MMNDDRLKILLCEDDENLGMLLREYLQAKGFVAELCADGEAGFKAFLKTKFDICVLDVMMPKKDGFTLAQEIRSANTGHPAPYQGQEEPRVYSLPPGSVHIRHPEAVAPDWREADQAHH